MVIFIDQVNELSGVFGQSSSRVQMHCTLFEDNNGALKLVIIPRYRPRTKHIAIKYHHFREQLQRGNIAIKQIGTND